MPWFRVEKLSSGAFRHLNIGEPQLAVAHSDINSLGGINSLLGCSFTENGAEACSGPPRREILCQWRIQRANIGGHNVEVCPTFLAA